MSTSGERETRSRFAERYAIPTADVNARIERAVIGAAWGANGYTTVDQADELARRLHIGPEARLLDIGIVRGWPGVYVATRMGCTSVGTDMPLGALAVAASRARTKSVDDRVALVAAGSAN